MNKMEILGYVGIIALLAGPLVMRVVARAVQPSRLKFADLGRELQAEADLPDSVRNLVGCMIRDAYNPWIVPALCATLPVFLALKALGRITPVPGLDDIRFKERLASFTDLHVRSILAANPFFAVFLILELMILGALFVLCSIMGRSARYSSPLRVLDTAVMGTEIVFRSHRLSWR